MKVFRCLSIAGILFLTAMSVGQTRPIHPPADYVDPGINSPPATGQTPKPEFPDVAIYRRNAEPVAGEPFHLVLEIRNMTAADISLAQLVFAEIKSDDGKIYPTGPVIPADSGEKLIAVLRIGIPASPGMPVPTFNGRLMQIQRANPTGGRAQMAEGAISIVIPRANTSLTSLDIPALLLKPGDNTIEFQLMQHGKIVATSGLMKMHCK